MIFSKMFLIYLLIYLQKQVDTTKVKNPMPRLSLCLHRGTLLQMRGSWLVVLGVGLVSGWDSIPGRKCAPSPMLLPENPVWFWGVLFELHLWYYKMSKQIHWSDGAFCFLHLSKRLLMSVHIPRNRCW